MEIFAKIEQIIYWALGQVAESDFEIWRAWIAEPALGVVLSFGAVWGYLLLFVTATLLRLRESGRFKLEPNTFEKEETLTFLWTVERTRGAIYQLFTCLWYLLFCIFYWFRASDEGKGEFSYEERSRFARYREAFSIGLAARLGIIVLFCALVELAIITVAFVLYTDNDIITRIGKPAVSQMYDKFVAVSQATLLINTFTVKLGIWSGLLTLTALSLEKFLDRDYRFDWQVRNFSEYELITWAKTASPREFAIAEVARHRFIGFHINIILFDIIVPSIAACVLPLGFVLLLAFPPFIAGLIKYSINERDHLMYYRIVLYWLAVVCIGAVWIGKMFFI